ncbi:tctex1 domain-containing protein 2-like isoform X2 [Folsomia candida]|uniref:tctex1 domain-containing protein 2-like isoform X2 n=1 Tax=Folsomia candida TaxID=158441 RepID=UPI001605572B|nr:tctex1 domain-containing protein 2-like isoform X2 [Folsomia candida]
MFINLKGKAVTVEVEPPANSTLSPQVLADLTALGYQMRPAFHERFSAEAVRAILKAFLEEFFATRKTYDFVEAEDWVEHVSKECVARVKKDMSNSSGRYKFVGHVVLGEHIGGGFHSGMKCCWDADSDMYATYTYLGDNLFCVVTICGIYTY